MTDTSRDTLCRDVISVDMGGTRVRLTHARAGQPTDHHEAVPSALLSGTNARQVLADTITRYRETCSLNEPAVVVGVPGMLDKDRNDLSHCNNIRNLEGPGLRSYLEQALSCDVLLEQDIMLQLLGEWHSGAARGSPAAFGAYLGTGIGSAYLCDGDPFRSGANSLQAGHIPMAGEGKPCLCGNVDCVEAYASGHTLQALADAAQLPVTELFCRYDDDRLTVALDRFLQFQAFMLATVITLLAPHTVVIGGGIPQMQHYPRQRLEQLVRTHLQKPEPANSVRIEWAQLGASAALHGAFALLGRSSTT